MDLPLEIERKFLVALPEESDLRKHAARCIAITQTYLLGTQEKIIRMRNITEDCHHLKQFWFMCRGVITVTLHQWARMFLL